MTMSLNAHHDVQGMIRRKPAVAGHRWHLFQLLCVTQQSERAIQQLEVFAQLSPHQVQDAQACRDLIRAERWRAKVRAGLAQQRLIFGPPTGVEKLVEALRLTANGQTEAADSMREAALDQVPVVGGLGAAHSLDACTLAQGAGDIPEPGSAAVASARRGDVNGTA
jgi:type VI secretion system protein ImpE